MSRVGDAGMIIATYELAGELVTGTQWRVTGENTSENGADSMLAGR